jgi:Transposase DDE domain
VTWLKPKTRPRWLAQETLAALPDSFVLREVRYPIGMPGFRTRQITLVTTLLDAESYPVTDLAELYRQRWQIETSLAHLKTTMQMEVLHCKTVPGVLKELTIFAIVYNLVRMAMWHSAMLQHLGVERISFLPDDDGGTPHVSGLAAHRCLHPCRHGKHGGLLASDLPSA